jgi:hypothetical protein
VSSSGRTASACSVIFCFVAVPSQSHSSVAYTFAIECPVCCGTIKGGARFGKGWLGPSPPICERVHLITPYLKLRFSASDSGYRAYAVSPGLAHTFGTRAVCLCTAVFHRRIQLILKPQGCTRGTCRQQHPDGSSWALSRLHRSKAAAAASAPGGGIWRTLVVM